MFGFRFLFIASVLAHEFISDFASLSQTVDFSKYPLNPAEKGYHDLVAECQARMKVRGYVHLPGFVFEDSARNLALEATTLAEHPNTFKSFEEHNVFLRDEQEDDSLATNHPRKIKFQSTKTVVSAAEIPTTSLLAQLFSFLPLQRFVQAVLEEETLFESSDPVGRFYYNVFAPGDALGWHFDNSLFSVSLILQPCVRGGDFCYWPNSRKEVEQWTEWDPWRAKSNAIVPDQQAGTLYIFRGNQSLHSVTLVEEGVRINAIFTYNSKPNVMLAPYTRKKFFGTDGEPPGSICNETGLAA